MTPSFAHSMLMPVIRPGLCAAILAIGHLCLAGCGSKAAEEDAEVVAEVKPVPELETMEDSRDALHDQFRRLVAAVKAGERQVTEEILSSYALPDADSWFKDHFGDDLGGTLAVDYAPQAKGLTQLEKVIRSLVDKGQSTILVERFEDSGAPDSVGYQSLALKRMKKKVPLYSIRLARDSKQDGFHLWSFVHDGTTFRWIGKMRGVSDEAADGDSDPLELRLRVAETLKLDNK